MMSLNFSILKITNKIAKIGKDVKTVFNILDTNHSKTCKFVSIIMFSGLVGNIQFMQTVSRRLFHAWRSQIVDQLLRLGLKRRGWHHRIPRQDYIERLLKAFSRFYDLRDTVHYPYTESVVHFQRRWTHSYLKWNQESWLKLRQDDITWRV